LTNDCDVLIALGMRFMTVTGNLDGYAKQAKVIHFEIDPSEVGQKCKDGSGCFSVLRIIDRFTSFYRR
jgi:thiamine pyrophosphate-dependent acetolactate synthase large subunit-like protein